MRYESSMFLKRTYSKNHTYLSIVETYRENGQVKHKTLLQLGREDELRANGVLQGLVSSIARVAGIAAAHDGGLCVEGFEEAARQNWGAVKVWRALWELFELDRILGRACRAKRRKFNFLAAVFTMVVLRLMTPCSKSKVHERQHEYLGVEEVSLAHFYRALDYLAAGKERIEQELFDRQRDLFNHSVDLVLYDVTTLYFESSPPDKLRDFGYGKDGKFNEMQVVVGLLVDMEGRPVGFDLFPGNTFEGRTLIAALRKLRRRFQIQRVIVVADRGINSKLNLHAIKRAGFEYMVGTRLKSLAGTVRKDVLDYGQYEPLKKNEAGEVELAYRSLNHENQVTLRKPDGSKEAVVLSERLVCTWSKERALKDRADRTRLVEKAHELLKTPSKLTTRRGAKRFIKNMVAGRPEIDPARIQEDAQWDGFYGIQSSHRELSPAFVISAYHSLWKIEDSFRLIKCTPQARPIFHWTPRRIKGHLIMCFLALLLERTLELKLKNEKVPVSPDTIREALSSLEVSVLKAGSQKLYLASKGSPLAGAVLKALKLAMPKPLTDSPPV